MKTDSKDGIKVKFRGGGTIVSLPPAFSQDASQVFVSHKNVILSYNTKTAIKILEYGGLTTSFAGFGCTYVNRQEAVVACTRQGVIAVWRVDTGTLISKIKLKLTVVFFKVLSCDGTSKAFVAIENEKPGKYTFALVNLANGRLEQQKLSLKSRQQTKMDASCNGKYYVVCRRNRLHFQRFGTEKIYKYRIRDRYFTCVACHPEIECVVTGDNTGRVLLWYSLNNRPTQAVFHWHTLPVKCLSFSTSGTYFYSGGSECVLVKWTNDDNLYKNFLPRLPSVVEHIALSNDNSLIAIATGDSGIQIVDARFNKVSVVQHLVLGSNFSAGIVYDPRSKALMLNGMVGHVQFYSPKDMDLLYNLDIVCQNKYTDERTTHIINMLVTKVALNKTGVWMATVEGRDDPVFPESQLKFWFFNATQQNFILNTCVQAPHKEEVIDLLFQPTYDKEEVTCVTLGRDKKFKIWRMGKASTGNYEGQSWQCLSAVFYRDLVPNALAFATDGSLLAIAFGPIVTTWLPHSCELKCSLKHCSSRDDLSHVSFGIGTQCHLVVSATAKQVSVWNLLTLSMMWTVPVEVSLIFSDPLTSFKAVISKDKKVFVFEPKSPNPVYTSERLLKDVGDVQTAAFIPSSYSSDVNLSWYRRSHVYFIDSNQEMYSIEMDDESGDSTTDQIYDESMNASLFGHMLPKIKSGVTTNLKVTHLNRKSSRRNNITQLLDAPAHTMAPLHLMCEAILHSMILENSQKTETTAGLKENGIVSDRHFMKDKDKKFVGVDKADQTDLSQVSLKSTSWTAVF